MNTNGLFVWTLKWSIFRLANKKDLPRILVPCVCGTVRARNQHWERKVWHAREQLTQGQPNVICEPLVDGGKIIFPLLHIKLGLMRQFVKARMLTRNASNIFWQKCPRSLWKILRQVCLMDCKSELFWRMNNLFELWFQLNGMNGMVSI